jgi:HAD superfamily hydrolase (TIGR01509 family)
LCYLEAIAETSFSFPPVGEMRAVVFDMDGLMFNTEDVYYRVGDEVLKPRGYRFCRELSDAMMGRPPQPAFEVMIRWHNLDATWEELKAESEVAFLELLDEHLAPMPGLLDLLTALEAAGIPKAIGTSSARRLVDACLSRLGLESRFQFILSAEDITHGKPHPEIYLRAAERFGFAPGEVLVLEDSETGCRAAAAAGTFTVAVPGEHSRQQNFSVAQLVIDSLADPRLYKVLKLPVAEKQ